MSAAERVTASLMSWSVWYSVRRFRRSDEWGPAIAALEAAAVEAEFDAEDAPGTEQPAD